MRNATKTTNNKQTTTTTTMKNNNCWIDTLNLLSLQQQLFVNVVNGAIDDGFGNRGGFDG
jgi:hypothetical protein